MHQLRLSRSTYRPGQRFQRHAHPHANVSVVLAGSLVERVGSAEETAGPLHVVVKPADTEHANTFGNRGAVLVQLVLEPEWLAELEDGSRAVGRWRWLHAPAAARWLLRLADLRPGDGVAAADGVAECLGALEGEAAESAAPVPGWLHRVRERIRDERGRGTRVAELARDAGVHPVYLTRRFRRAFGGSVVACIQAERLRAAADAVASGEDPISRIAHDAGFTDQSHLGRAFRRLAGVTPGAYRRLGRGPQV